MHIFSNFLRCRHFAQFAHDEAFCFVLFDRFLLGLFFVARHLITGCTYHLKLFPAFAVHNLGHDLKVFALYLAFYTLIMQFGSRRFSSAANMLVHFIIRVGRIAAAELLHCSLDRVLGVFPGSGGVAIIKFIHEPI